MDSMQMYQAVPTVLRVLLDSNAPIRQTRQYFVLADISVLTSRPAVASVHLDTAVQLRMSVPFNVRPDFTQH